jgi:hypothetical protein
MWSSGFYGFIFPSGLIYPDPMTPYRLRDAGVAEVKFNLETATDRLFSGMCPGLSREDIWSALRAAVLLFGKNHVFSNIILGLGETDGEMAACIEQLCQEGIIPVIRPLTPGGELVHASPPEADRILAISLIHESLLHKYGLDPRQALTMCPAAPDVI